MIDKEIDIEEMNFDFTPMIDVVFLLLIFFMLMPAKKMDKVLEASLPQHSGSGPNQPLMNKLQLRAKEVGDDIVVRVIFNNSNICEFKSFSKASLNEVYKLEENEMNKILTEQSRIDRLQFHAVTGTRIPHLINVIKESLKSTEKGFKTDVFIDADSKVPFKIIMAIINAGNASGVRNLKFKKPHNKIWNSM